MGYIGSMTTEKDNKLKILQAELVSGSICLAGWLESKGISRDLQQYYCKSGWMESVGRGAYKRPDGIVQWESGLSTLHRQTKLSVHVGGLSALALQGASQYIRLGRKEKIYIFSPVGTSLPAWFINYDWGVEIVHVRSNFLPAGVELGFAGQLNMTTDSGLVPYAASSGERAILECLYLVPDKFDMVECYQLMESLVNLRPKNVQYLLEQCKSIKVKRLFLYMAEKIGHTWLQFVDLEKVTLGSGDRSFTNKGVYDSKYKINIPKELATL